MLVLSRLEWHLETLKIVYFFWPMLNLTLQLNPLKTIKGTALTRRLKQVEPICLQSFLLTTA